MSMEDEREFLDFASELVDRIDEHSSYQFFLHVDDERIQLLRTVHYDDCFEGGRIALRTHGSEAAKRAESIFRKMQRRIKKRYFNEINGRNVNIPESVTQIKDIWVGPGALRAYRESSIVLTQNRNKVVVFEPRKQENGS